MFTAIHLDALLLASSVPLVPPVPPQATGINRLTNKLPHTDTPTQTRNTP